MVYSCMVSSHGKMSQNFTYMLTTFEKSFLDKIEINGLDKAFVKSFQKRYTI